MGTKYLFTHFELPFAYQFSTLFFGGGGVCATQQGTVFTFLTLEKGVKITLHLWRRGKCYLSMTLEQKLFNFFP